MTVKLRTIYSNADGKRAEYRDADGKIGFRTFPVGTSDKEIVAVFASGQLPDDGKEPETDKKKKAADAKAARKSAAADTPPDDGKPTPAPGGKENLDG